MVTRILKAKALLILLCAVPALAAAQVPSKVGYQGRLLKSDGTPESGAVQVTFTIFSDPNAGTQLFTETQSLALTDGYYSTFIGETIPIDATVFTGPERFLEVKVNGTALSPRAKLASVPYALMAGTAASVSGGNVVIDSAGIKVGGNVVVDGTTGKLAGAAAYSTPAGSGLSLSSGGAFSLMTCTANQVLQSSGNGWACGTIPPGITYSAAPNGGLTLSGNAFALDTLGRLSTNPGADCKDIKTRNPAAADGLYFINPAGAGGTPFQAYCDMSRDGGGWTLMMRVWYQSGLAGNVNGFGSPHEANNAVKVGPYKLADSVVQQVIGASNNFDVLVDQLNHNSAYSNGNHEYVIVRNYTGVYTYAAPVPESSTATVFESYRAVDNQLAWRGRLGCGEAGYGINCGAILSTPSPVGAPNPQGGLGCLINMGTSTNSGWHHLYQGLTNTDTYVYICNGAQHTSSYANLHRWWVRAH